MYIRTCNRNESVNKQIQKFKFITISTDSDLNLFLDISLDLKFHENMSCLGCLSVSIDRVNETYKLSPHLGFRTFLDNLNFLK
jgi:hypothetical protein